MPKTQKINITRGTVAVELTPEYLQAIGHVTAQWSLLEMYINLTIRGLLGISQRQSHALTSRNGISVQLDMVRALAKETLSHNHTKKRFDTIAKRALSAMKERNNVVHAVWGMETDGLAVRVKFTGYGEVKHHSVKMSIKDIEAIAAEISSITGDVHGFLLDNSLIWNE